MDQDWGDWGEDGDYHGDAAETANLGDPDEPLASGAASYGDSEADSEGYPGDGGDYAAGEPGTSDSGGFLEDDPMGAFSTDADTDPLGDPGDDGDPGDPDAFGSDSDGAPDSASAGGGPGDATGDGPDAAGNDLGPDAADDPDASADPGSVVGADPDVDPDADWSPADFPAQLDFAAPEPVDGYPWTDPSAVAAPGTGGDDPSATPDGAPPAQDLLDYAGTDGGADPWSALVGSDDPAASSLGRWWAPGT